MSPQETGCTKPVAKDEADNSDVSLDIFAAEEKPASKTPEVSSAQAASGPALEKADSTKKAKAPLRPSYVEFCLLLYSVFYAAVSRVPFTLFTIYMINVLDFSYLIAALTLGLYCFGRLVGAHLAGMYAGSVTMVFGTACGGISWGSILLFEHMWIFVASTFVLGFTETVTGLDTMLKIESLVLRRLPEQTQIIFRCQLICTCVGVFLAYMGGGFLYQRHGMQPVGLCCIAFTCINLVILALMFPKRRVFRQPLIRLGDIVAECEASAPTRSRKSRASVGGKEARATQRVSTYNIDAIKIIDGDDAESKGDKEKGQPAISSSPMSTQFFLGTVVACFFFTTLGISTQFAISALYWQQVWSVGPDVVGTIMAVGECLGVCLLVIFAQPKVFNSPVTRHFGKPVNVLNACMGMGVMMYLITADNMIACAIGSVSVHMCNVCVHSFQAELIGICASGEDFATWISRSYVVKRLANCVCVFGSIVFFEGFGPQMSYRVIGSGLILYAVVLCGIYRHINTLPYQQRSAQKEAPPSCRASMVVVS